jgi:protein-tyrosine phosphatase
MDACGCIITGVGFIRTHRRAGENVVVACGAGMSRSAALVAAFLVEEGEDLTDAFLTVPRQRPIIMPHPVILRSLVEHYQVAASTETILAQLARERRLLRHLETRDRP